MGDNSVPSVELNNRAPSVYRIWQKARSEGGSEAEILDKYRLLLERYGHRDPSTAQWTVDSGFLKSRRTISKPGSGLG